MKICENYFADIARNNPDQLHTTIENTPMNMGMKSRAVSTIRHMENTGKAITLCSFYLGNPDSMVHIAALEALYDLCQTRNSSFAIALLHEHYHRTGDRVIKSIAREMLEDFNVCEEVTPSANRVEAATIYPEGPGTPL